MIELKACGRKTVWVYKFQAVPDYGFNGINFRGISFEDVLTSNSSKFNSLKKLLYNEYEFMCAQN